MIGVSAPTPCAGCGQVIIGEGWDMVWLEWNGELIGRVRHAFSPACTKAITDRRDAALKARAA